ncbi:MAG: ribonuclease HII [Firmicutes bacterium]|nr:ribonuclease HII [Bacillota bacterium]
MSTESERINEMYLIEEEYYKKGITLVAGCDEAGRGPLAGPVVAAAVILPPHCEIPYLNDSKKLTEKRRFALEPIIKEQAVAWAVTRVEHDEIDEINILEASLKAMKMALEQLSVKAEAVLIDGPHGLRNVELPMEAVVKGDARSASIAAASILAKTERDRVMVAYDELYPEYGFKKHKGYPTKAHREAVKEYGFSPIHRKTFKVK